jgi:hypothetical protein
MFGDDLHTQWLKAGTAKLLTRGPQKSFDAKHHANNRSPFLTIFDSDRLNFSGGGIH